MNEQSAKPSTRETVAMGLSIAIILAGAIYWLLEIVAVFDLLEMANEYSVMGILGRFLLMLIGAVIIVGLVVFVHRKANK